MSGVSSTRRVEPGNIPVGRLVRPADFERVLRTRTQVNSAHFAVHHVADRPSRPSKPAKTTGKVELSTGTAPIPLVPVDDSAAKSVATVEMVVSESALPADSAGLLSLWLGYVVPKRHAKRSVTRSLLKRQIRAAVSGQAAALAGGLWVVRLRAPFDKSAFPSAASSALQHAARTELEQLMARAVRHASAAAR
ncbi:hypothetical protein BH11PSE9_BH11PSE9_36200 [soil metagenome]